MQALATSTFSRDMQTDEEIADYFIENSYTVVRKIINTETLRLIDEYLSIQQQHGYFYEDRYTPSAKYADILMEALLSQLLPKISKYAGKDLDPTYSYLRIYEKGAELPAHIDRHECEYSVSLTLSYQSKDFWPLYIIKGNKKIYIPLDKGDILLYKGNDILHGRDKFVGDKWIQVFLHYVDKNGPYASNKFDKREKLGDKKKL